MDISLIISSNTKRFDELLYLAIQSAITNCPANVEVIVVSPYDIPRQFPNTTFIKDDKSSGCGYSFNLGVKASKGKYVALCPDDYRLHSGWWGIIGFMQERNVRYASFLNGAMAGISYGHMPCVERSLLEGSLRGMIYNETFFHQYLDNDLGFRLHFLEGLSCPEMRNGNWVYDGNHADTEKWLSKRKYFRLDGITFVSLWGKKIDVQACNPPKEIYPENFYDEDELLEMSKKQLEKNPYKDLYDLIPDKATI